MLSNVEKKKFEWGVIYGLQHVSEFISSHGSVYTHLIVNNDPPILQIIIALLRYQ